MIKRISEHLLFVPLGGAGEIGMNLNLYGYGSPGKELWVMIDLGVSFKSKMIEGIDTIMPDISFIESKKDKLAALILTHAHEDHIGAVPYLWPRLKCPIYASPFTASILKLKFQENGFGHEPDITVQDLSSSFNVGPFNFEYVTLTHSIPEPNAIAIKTKLGNILHTGDWKFDPKPVYGSSYDENTLQRLGAEGLLALVCDSTNVFRPGTSGSESELLKDLEEIIEECKGKVLVACFASNVARLQTIALAANKNKREVALSGRSLKRIQKAAIENGYMRNTKNFISDEECRFLPDNRILIICTGSQGEPRAALKKIAHGRHPHISIGEGDTVIFSSRKIPGNEIAINELVNQLTKIKVRVVTPGERFLHVSGHPSRDELIKMYKLTNPKISLPVHGEYRHLNEHARLALSCGVNQAIVLENGNLVKFSQKKARIIDQVVSGRLALDGNRIIPTESEIFKSRKRALWNGTATLTIKVDLLQGKVFAPRIVTTGLFEHESEEGLTNTCQIAQQAIEIQLNKNILDCKELEKSSRIAVRRYLKKIVGKKPITTIHIVDTKT